MLKKWYNAITRFFYHLEADLSVRRPLLTSGGLSFGDGGYRYHVVVIRRLTLV